MLKHGFNASIPILNIASLLVGLLWFCHKTIHVFTREYVIGILICIVCLMKGWATNMPQIIKWAVAFSGSFYYFPHGNLNKKDIASQFNSIQSNPFCRFCKMTILHSVYYHPLGTIKLQYCSFWNQIRKTMFIKMDLCYILVAWNCCLLHWTYMN